MFYTAVVMGLAGSLHCAGMCSPLAVAVLRNRPFLLSSLLYNTGRVFLYSLLGTAAATFGSFLHLYPYQQIISIGLGVFFLLVGSGIKGLRLPYFDKGVTVLTCKLKKIFGVITNQKSGIASFMFGMINGLLPCGITYLALSSCLILPSALDGFLFMIFFGLGTWPGMIGLTRLMNAAFSRNLLSSLPRFSRLAMISIGCLLLLRVWWVHPHGEVRLESSDKVTVCK
jgi:uncharacterized protein